MEKVLNNTICHRVWNPSANPSPAIEISRKASFTCTVNVAVFVSGTFDLFDVMCKRQHWTALNPFLPPENEVWGKVIFSEACVKNSVHGGGLPQCMLGYHPSRPGPPGAGTPPDQAPPPGRACWEIRSMSGRYASYWNAILLNGAKKMVTLTRLYDAFYRDNFTKRIWLVANVHPHLKQPDEEGPFKCEEPGCEQTFKCQSTFSSHKLKHTGQHSAILMFVINVVFEITQAPFAFEYESEWRNGNLVTRQSPNYYLANLEKLVELPHGSSLIKQFESEWWNGNLATVLLPNCHSAVQTQTQTQTEPEAYRMYDKFKNIVCETSHLWERYILGIRPHECKTCKKTFMYKGALTVHMRDHTGK